MTRYFVKVEAFERLPSGRRKAGSTRTLVGVHDADSVCQAAEKLIRASRDAAEKEKRPPDYWVF